MNYNEAHDLLYEWLEGVSIMRHEASVHANDCSATVMLCESPGGSRWRQGRAQADRLEGQIIQALVGGEEENEQHARMATKDVGRHAELVIALRIALDIIHKHAGTADMWVNPELLED